MNEQIHYTEENDDIEASLDFERYVAWDQGRPKYEQSKVIDHGEEMSKEKTKVNHQM